MKDLPHSLQSLVITGFIAALLASCAQQSAPVTDSGRAERHIAYFNEADTNADGVIDGAEIDTAAAADFASMDYNADSVVTIEDVYNAEQGEPEGAARNMDLSSHLPYDSNSDGTITAEEYRAYIDAQIQKADLNGDIQITLDEYRAYEEF